VPKTIKRLPNLIALTSLEAEIDVSSKTQEREEISPIPTSSATFSKSIPVASPIVSFECKSRPWEHSTDLQHQMILLVSCAVGLDDTLR
jgi:hypothetical protein